MSLQEFVNQYSGKSVDFDGAYGAQCVDLMNQYLVACLGIANPIQTFPGATAFQIYQNASDPRFQKVANTPTGVPQGGDIVFWDTSIGSAGHVAVFVSGDTNSFTSFDQNWPVGSSCHEQTHDYKGVAGWLHPVTQLNYETLFNQCRLDRDQHWNDLQAATAKIEQLQKTIDSLNQTLTTRNTDVTALQDQVATLQHQAVLSASGTTEQINELRTQITELTKERDQYLAANKTLNDKVAQMAQVVQTDALEDADVHTKLLDKEHEITTIKNDAQNYISMLINLFIKKKAR